MHLLTALAAAAVTAAQPTPPAPAAAPAKPCSTPGHHSWDFWLGSWRVTGLDGSFKGTNEITLAPSGCGLVENWTSAGGGKGTSLNVYDPVRQTWTQLWVAPGYMIRMEGPVDAKGAVTMSGVIGYFQRKVEHPFKAAWTAQPDGSVKQEFWEQDPATGQWAVWFTGIYRRP